MIIIECVNVKKILKVVFTFNKPLTPEKEAIFSETNF